MTGLRYETGKEWLAAWDAGEVVQSVEMGGLGPSYEQAIQISAAEVLRFLIEQNMSPAMWDDEDAWKADRTRIEEYSLSQEGPLSELGITGAQYGAALSLACIFHRRGPRGSMEDPFVKDRLIWVSKEFPKH